MQLSGTIMGFPSVLICCGKFVGMSASSMHDFHPINILWLRFLTIIAVLLDLCLPICRVIFVIPVISMLVPLAFLRIAL